MSLQDNDAWRLLALSRKFSRSPEKIVTTAFRNDFDEIAEKNRRNDEQFQKEIAQTGNIRLRLKGRSTFNLNGDVHEQN